MHELTPIHSDALQLQIPVFSCQFVVSILNIFTKMTQGELLIPQEIEHKVS